MFILRTQIIRKSLFYHTFLCMYVFFYCIENVHDQDLMKYLWVFSFVVIAIDFFLVVLMLFMLFYQAGQYITTSDWNIDGKQFMTGHWNGSISIWNYKNGKKPDEKQIPHGIY